MLRHTPLSLSLALSALFALAGCGEREAQGISIAVIGQPGTVFDAGPRPALGARMLRAATAEGLVALDEEGRVVPALADRWIVTDDGQSYIFRLRAGAWPDGTPITGEAVRAALNTALAAQRGTALGLDLDGIEEVREMAGRVIELRLRHPAPELLQLLAQPELGLLHRGRGNGPLALRRDRQAVQLTAIAPEKRGLPPIEGWADLTRPVRLVALSGEAATLAYAAGEVAAVVGGTFADAPRTTRTALGRSTARADAVVGLFGLLVTSQQGLLTAPENREALAMAIDRAALAESLPVGGWLPTTRVVGRGVVDDSGMIDERWQGRPMAERQASAAARVARWTRGGKAPVLRVALPVGPGADLLAARLSADFAAIGIRFERVGLAERADLRLIDEVARYPRTAWFLNQLSCLNLAGPCSHPADLLAERARNAADPTEATDLLAQAEAMLTQENIYVPLGGPVRWSLWSGSDLGLAANRWGYHPLAPITIRADTR